MKVKTISRKNIRFGLEIFVLVLLLLIAVLPVLFTLISSFFEPSVIQKAYGTVNDGNASSRLLLFPFPVTIRQYQEVFLNKQELLYGFWNSVWLTLPILVGSVVFSLCSGYALAKFEFPGRTVLLFLYIVVMLLPQQVILIGDYLFFQKLSLLGTRAAVILPGMFSSLGAFLLYKFIRAVPDETLEYGRLDGASEIRLFFSIVIPQVKSGIASMLILVLIDCWNMIEQPFILLKDDRLMPLSVMMKYMNIDDIQSAFVCAVVATIPIYIVFMLVHENLVEGIAYSVPGKLGENRRKAK